jgi:5-methylcytosine-specific restriction protein A
LVLPLAQIIGNEAFKSLQDMWAQSGKRHRWSVAFPIIETHEIVGRPKAKDVFGVTAYHRLYQRPSATLRELKGDERNSIANLDLKTVVSPNAWIGIEDEFDFAKSSDINRRTQQLIDIDLSALEGISEERRGLVKLRAAWLADKFIITRVRASTLFCDDCGFDPTAVFPKTKVNPRSLLDVHHKNPISEGVRYTTIADFALLCPNCHRIEHVRLRLSKH